MTNKPPVLASTLLPENTHPSKKSNYWLGAIVSRHKWKNTFTNG